MIENPSLKKAISVSELNRQVKRLLELSYGQVWVSGEISGLSRPGSGHWYFTLKDEKAQLRCAMFKGFNQRLKFIPKEGDQVIVRGKLSLYEGRGDYQLIAEAMEPAGLGQLQAAFEALKLKLSQEGLFDPNSKKPISEMPSKVVVVTSATGAVIHDIISVCKRRFPLLEIQLLPVNVQGEGAAREIASAIELANRENLAELIIVGRGGGSLEDLWAFNEEVVARAIYTSQLPIVSAVGHETDYSIADLVADYRAPTPSAAAEKITPDQYDVMQLLDQQQRKLQFLIETKLRALQQRVDNYQRHIKHPGELLKDKQLRVLELAQRSRQNLINQLRYANQRLQTHSNSLQKHSPAPKLSNISQHIAHLFLRLRQSQQQLLDQKRHRFSIAAQTLNATSPLATLGRGYAIIGTKEKRVITASDELKPGSRIRAQLKRGSIECTVNKVLPEQRELALPLEK